MRLLLSLLQRRDILRRILLERLTAPVHLNLLALVVAVLGTTRAKIAFDLLVRQEYAYGLLSAADAARRRGLSRVTVVELGVGGGVEEREVVGHHAMLLGQAMRKIEDLIRLHPEDREPAVRSQIVDRCRPASPAALPAELAREELAVAIGACHLSYSRSGVASRSAF